MPQQINLRVPYFALCTVEFQKMMHTTFKEIETFSPHKGTLILSPDSTPFTQRHQNMILYEKKILNLKTNIFLSMLDSVIAKSQGDPTLGLESSEKGKV